MRSFFLFPPLKIDWLQFGGFFVVIPQKKLCWFNFGLGLFWWFVWGFFSKKGAGKEQIVHREKAWKVPWHCQLTSILTFLRFPLLKHHPYLEAFQGKSGVLVEQKNHFLCTLCWCPAISSSWLVTIQHLLHIFPFLLWSCSAPCFLRLPFSWGQPCCNFPRHQRPQGVWRQKTWVLLLHGFINLLAVGFYLFLVSAITGTPHLSTTCLPKSMEFGPEINITK